MKVEFLSFDDVPQFSKRDKAYVEEVDALAEFYKFKVSLEAFSEVLAERKKYTINRKLLVDVLNQQYNDMEASKEVTKNIASLASPNTYTVTTAHQPALCTGPLYYIYKIVSTINLSRNLNEKYKDFHFVPVFISGGEDHDFEEVNHFNLFGGKFEWKNEEKGSVGRMSTSTLKSVLDQVKGKLGESENAEFLKNLLDQSYGKFDTYGKASMALVNGLFKKYGLVAINMDDAALKNEFVPCIKKELFENISEAPVLETQKSLEKLGFKSQAHPRAINLFYLVDQIRERIVFEDDKFKALNTDLSFSKSEMEKLVEEHPERFSPNVIMRPIYQESILPNLAYIGGGGEIAYWLERKTQFEKFNVSFPMLIRRDSVLWIDGGNAKKMNKLGLSFKSFFTDTDALTKSFVKENASYELNFNEEQEKLEVAFELISKKISNIDPTLEKRSKADQAKFLKGLKELEAKLVKAEKNKNEVAVGQISKIATNLFPGNSLQERKDNFMGLYLKYGSTFFEVLFEHLDPLRKKMVVVVDG